MTTGYRRRRSTRCASGCSTRASSGARPGLDDKVITEWNALMIASLAEAGALLGEPSWVDAAADAGALPARRAARRRPALVARSWHADGTPRARHAALAADHAALLDAFTRLGEATGEASWIDEAMDVADTLLDHFWDPGEGGLFTTPDDGEALVVRQKDLFDNATAVGQLDRRRRPRPTRRADRRGALRQPRRPHPGARRPARQPRRQRLLATRSAPLALRTRGVTEIAVVGDRPDLVAVARERLAARRRAGLGRAATTPRCGTAAPTASPTCASNYACQAPQDTPEGLRDQLAV